MPAAKIEVTTPAASNPSPTDSESAKTASCILPDVVYHFDLASPDRFNKVPVKEAFRSQTEDVVQWLKQNPNCKVQVEGHTCTIGNNNINAPLGLARANTVYQLLYADEAIRGQLVQYVSLSKEKATSERNPPDRRVILRVVGSASGK